jgi:prolyl 4-hydroxylase
MPSRLASHYEMFVHLYNLVFTEDECKSFIDYHNSNESEIIQGGKTKFYQVETTDKTIMNKLIDIGKQYMSNYPDCFPTKYAIEKPRIKKYDIGDQFDWHVDIKDASTCGRFIAFLVYLNDDFEMGNTIFQDFQIRPKTGSVLIFPPMWMYRHKGDSPSNVKYIMSSYLRYV